LNDNTGLEFAPDREMASKGGKKSVETRNNSRLMDLVTTGMFSHYFIYSQSYLVPNSELTCSRIAKIVRMIWSGVARRIPKFLSKDGPNIAIMGYKVSLSVLENTEQTRY